MVWRGLSALLMPECWKGGSDQLLNLRSESNIVGLVLDMDQLINFLPLQVLSVFSARHQTTSQLVLASIRVVFCSCSVCDLHRHVFDAIESSLKCRRRSTLLTAFTSWGILKGQNVPSCSSLLDGWGSVTHMATFTAFTAWGRWWTDVLHRV